MSSQILNPSPHTLKVDGRRICRNSNHTAIWQFDPGTLFVPFPAQNFIKYGGVCVGGLGRRSCPLLCLSQPNNLAMHRKNWNQWLHPFANAPLCKSHSLLFLFHICLASNQRLAFPSEPAGALPRLAAEQSNPSLGIRKEAPRHQKGDPGCLAGGFLDTTNTNTCINTNTSSNTNTSTDSNTNSFEPSKCLTFCWQGFQKDLHCLRRLAELLPWLHNRFVSPQQ